MSGRCSSATESVAIRLAIGPSPRRIELPAGYGSTPGVGVTLRDGADVMLVSYGPVMLHEALTRRRVLASARHRARRSSRCRGSNRVDPTGSRRRSPAYRDVLVVEDHAPVGALGDTLRRALAATGLDRAAPRRAGVEGWPACGTPPEALRHHGLDGASLAERVAAAVGASAAR